MKRSGNMLAKLQNYYGLTKGKTIALLIDIPIIIISLITIIVLATINVTAYEIPIIISLLIAMFSGTGLVAIISLAYNDNVQQEKQAIINLLNLLNKTKKKE